MCTPWLSSNAALLVMSACKKWEYGVMKRWSRYFCFQAYDCNIHFVPDYDICSLEPMINVLDMHVYYRAVCPHLYLRKRSYEMISACIAVRVSHPVKRLYPPAILEPMNTSVIVIDIKKTQDSPMMYYIKFCF